MYAVCCGNMDTTHSLRRAISGETPIDIELSSASLVEPSRSSSRNTYCQCHRAKRDMQYVLRVTCKPRRVHQAGKHAASAILFVSIGHVEQVFRVRHAVCMNYKYSCMKCMKNENTHRRKQMRCNYIFGQTVSLPTEN